MSIISMLANAQEVHMSRIATIAVTAGAMVVLITGAQAAAPQSQSAGTTTAAPTQTQTMSESKQNKTVDKSLLADRDEDFLKHAGQATKVEIAASQLATTKAANAEVKAFAERLVTDHTACNSELMPFVVAKNVSLKDDDPDFKIKTSKHESLQKLSGAAFDKEYLEDMISDHEDAIVLFSNEAVKSKDEELKSWAYKTLPTLKEHLRVARELREKLFK
jgi:putative membrane protein